LQFGLSEEEYDKALAFQGGVCAICLKPPVTVALGTDHEHASGLTRGFTCMTCNKAIAYLRDSRERALRVAAYLDLPPVTAALGHEVYGRPGRVSRRLRGKEKRILLEKHAAALAALKAKYGRR
jgi:hypothetical protein